MGRGEKNRKSKIENLKSLGRREWLLRLGETAALMGFSGAVREARLDASSAAASPPATSQLPPGLYEPSNDHLAHALSSDTPFHPLAAGSETDYVVPRSGPFQPEFLLLPEFKTVRRIVELVIGHPAASSGTGSAALVSGSAAGYDRQAGSAAADEVAEWIDLRLSKAAAVREAAERLAPDHRTLAGAFYGSRHAKELETADPQKICREGLHWLEDNSQRGHQQPFPDLNESQQLELLRTIADDRSDKTQEDAGPRFFAWIKGEIIRGYYTSRTGLKDLDYKGNGFYAQPPGCEGRDHAT
jgi:hypothetical protein